MSKIALVTGASRGLGFAIAEALAASHHVVAVARTTGALEDLDDRIQAAGGQATLAPMDITNEGAMAQLCRSIYDRWGSIDLWVHCAVHAAPLTPAAHIDPKDWAKSMSINATSMGTLIPYIAPLLGASGTAMFFDDQTTGDKFHGCYAASKAAQITLARSWARESTNTGPRVLVEVPPAMSTATRARFHPGEDRAALAHPRDVAAGLLPKLLSA
ncbi:SDR family NAD(P)-dependent oxidoreductase [Planktotalea arctica]|uniref:SDR family NAD(P)-dependent oxidoreductase n=1 Tax=Planktotalea arctica TaxID=1481893 RepID=UPI00321AF3D4